MPRKTPELNLQAELPEVRSTDFNLFYKPDVRPIDTSVKVFTTALDNFVNGAGTGLVLQAEKKEKELNEAEALEQFNKNRTDFNTAVSNGEIPKEASPYFQEKYKELTLNKKAQEFKSKIYQDYATKNVLENPDPNAFDKFYNDALKDFVKENNLGVFDALQLEKGFFSETSKTRNGLFNTHVQSQMSKIGEDYKLNFKETIQGKFDKNKNNAEIGADISLFVQDAVKNNLSKSTAQKYLLESLKEYAETTQDLEFAERLLRDLPNHLKLGTDSLGNVKGLQNDFDAIKQKIDDRVLQKEKDEATKLSIAQQKDTLEASKFADKYDTFSEAIQDPEYNTFSRNKRNEVFKEFESREVGFDSQTDPRVEDDLFKLLEENKFKEAMEYLRKNVPNVTASFYSDFKQKINDFTFAEKDGLLASRYYNHFKDKIEDITKSTNTGKFPTSPISPLEHKKFEATMKSWLATNKIEDFKNATERKTAFEKYVKEEYSKIEEIALNEKGSFTDGNVTVDGNDNTPTIKKGSQETIKANKNELTQSKKPTRNNTNSRAGANPENRADDPELKIDLASVVIIPKNLSRGKLVQFRKNNPNAMSQEDYDRILEKQTAYQIALGDTN